jgi:hypothetical protein
MPGLHGSLSLGGASTRPTYCIFTFRCNVRVSQPPSFA